MPKPLLAPKIKEQKPLPAPKIKDVVLIFKFQMPISNKKQVVISPMLHFLIYKKKEMLKGEPYDYFNAVCLEIHHFANGETLEEAERNIRTITKIFLEKIIFETKDSIKTFIDISKSNLMDNFWAIYRENNIRQASKGILSPETSMTNFLIKERKELKSKSTSMISEIEGLNSEIKEIQRKKIPDEKIPVKMLNEESETLSYAS